MASATHGRWCEAKTYPAQCRYCGRPVLYFTCNCRSKVFFDELGWPWPEHRCLGYLIAQYGKTFIESALAHQVMRGGARVRHRIDHRYGNRVRHHIASGAEDRITRCDPMPGARVEETGVVREIISEVDVFAKLRVPNTAIGRALLGSLAREAHYQLTLHVYTADPGQVLSYTFFAPAWIVDRLSLSRGGLLTFEIISHAVPGRAAVWMAPDLRHSL